MSALPEIYADTMGEITLSGGMVRIDLVSLAGSSQSKEGQQPKLEPRMRVIMSPDGFLRSFGAMENLVKQLVDAGLVKQRPNQAAPEKASGDSAKSPNF
jgi:hypothetical protein